MSNILFASSSPHQKSRQTTRRIMIDVLIALLPATVVGCVFFGYKAVIVLAASIAAAIATEFIWLFACGKNIRYILKQFDFTSAVTGLLLGLCLNSGCAWYVAVLSAVFAVGVVKMLFGGTGKNLVNPAITGRIFAFIAFQSIVINGFTLPNFSPALSDVFTGATPLKVLTEGSPESLSSLGNLNLFLGIGVAGCIGETSKAALLVGYIYLVVRRVIDWKFPLITIASCGLMSVALNGFNFAYFLPSILSGGLFLGAIFMATDYVTSPKTQLASVIYFLILGVVIAALRKATGIEVVSFAIMLMNLLVPLFNRYIRPKPFGYKKQKRSAAEK